MSDTLSDPEDRRIGARMPEPKPPMLTPEQIQEIRDFYAKEHEDRIRADERQRTERDMVGRLAAYVESCATGHVGPEWSAAYEGLAAALREIECGDATLFDGPLGAALRAPSRSPKDQS